MKTPEERKDFLQKLRVVASETDDLLTSCDASDLLDGLEVARDFIFEAGCLIEQLESELAKTKRERDALWFDLACMPNACDVCAHGVQNDNDCDELFGHNSGCDFKWRGVCPENLKEENR